MSMNLWILNVTIFASSFSHYSFKEMHLQPGENVRIQDVDGVKFIWLRTVPYVGNDWRRVLNMVSYAWRAFCVGLRLDEKPDVIIGTSVHLLAPFAAYVLSRFKGSRFFFEVTDLWPETLVMMSILPQRSPLTWAIRALEGYLYQKAERIVSVLPHLEEYTAGLGIPKDKVVWIPNGVDLSRYDNLRSYDGRVSDHFTIMYLGSHTYSNSLDVVLDAAEILQDEGSKEVKFVFVGDGTEKPALMKRAQGMGLKNVEFRGLVPKRDISRVMAEADAFIFSLRKLILYRYGISLNKMCDYLASGRPILYAGSSANNPVGEAGAGLTVPPENPRALADAVVQLATMNPEQRVQMGNAGFEYVRKYFDMNVLIGKLERILRSE